MTHNSSFNKKFVSSFEWNIHDGSKLLYDMMSETKLIYHYALIDGSSKILYFNEKKLIDEDVYIICRCQEKQQKVFCFVSSLW